MRTIFDWIWYWYRFWNKDEEEDNAGENACMICGYPAYKRWDKRCQGYRGFCTRCGIDWPES